MQKSSSLVSKPNNVIPKHDYKLPRVCNSNNHKAQRVTTPMHSSNPLTPNKHNTPSPDKQSIRETVHKHFTYSKVAKLGTNTDQANAVLNVGIGQLEKHGQL